MYTSAHNDTATHVDTDYHPITDRLANTHPDPTYGHTEALPSGELGHHPLQL